MAPELESGRGANHVSGLTDRTDTSRAAGDSYEVNSTQSQHGDHSFDQRTHDGRYTADPDGLPRNGAGRSTDGAGVYDDVYNARGSAPPVPPEDIPLPSVKIEPAGDDLEYRPIFDGTHDHPTSKKLANLKSGKSSRASPASDRSSPALSVKPATGSKKTTSANLKNESASRASTSDRSSPATSVRPTANKKAGSAATKKGTAKKPAPKKRKLNDADGDSVDGRSNTPASRTSKTPGRKQGSVSLASSPAPEEKKRKPKPRGRKLIEDADMDDDDDEDDDTLYCLCRKPDNHDWMVACDGPCLDWYHGKCVNIPPSFQQLIERYICPLCADKGIGSTTWKPKCRLSDCHAPARVTSKPRSKYCSDKHGVEFMRRQVQSFKFGPAQATQPDLGSMGGVLTPGDLKAVITSVSSVAEFRDLGNRILDSAIKSDGPEPQTNGHIQEVKDEIHDQQALDLEAKNTNYSAAELAKIEKIRTRKEQLVRRKDTLSARSTFVGLLRQRTKSLAEKFKELDSKGNWKDLCGFDFRLSWSDSEFDEWRLSDAGKKALTDGTIEAFAASCPDADSDTPMGADDNDKLSYWAKGVCTRKRCERHKQWIKVQQQDAAFEESVNNQQLAQSDQELRTISERAALRTWVEKENAPSHEE